MRWTITEYAYAKINLFLDIKSKLSNGYHEIVSVMQTVDWFDKIIVSNSVSNEIKIQSNNILLPVGDDNTAYRAANLFLEECGSKQGVCINIEKNIPIAAGMAGGSADAAAVLLAINRLFGSPLSTDDLLSLGGKIGADVPFCILGGTKLIEGIGECIRDCAAMPECIILCAKLGEGVSTPQAYQMLDKRFDDFYLYSYHATAWDKLLDGLGTGDLGICCDHFYNIFEEVICESRPAVQTLKTLFDFHGGVSLMSGSGPSVFAVFTDQDAAERACRKAIALGAQVKLCRPIHREGV